MTRGRPPLGDLARSIRRDIYLTPADAAALDEAAAGEPLGSYIIAALGLSVVPDLDTDEGALLRTVAREPDVWSLAREREIKSFARRHRGLLVVTQMDRVAAAPTGPRVTATLTPRGQRALDRFIVLVSS